MIDGSEADVTSRNRGTNYTSSDLNIASFGAESGRVFAGQDGVAAITVTNGGFSAEVQLTVGTFAPTPITYLDLKQEGRNVALEGNFAYVATIKGLVVASLADPAAPFIASSLNIEGAVDVKVADGFAYLATASGLAVVSIADPANPVLVTMFSSLGQVNDISLAEGVAYLATETSGFAAVDVSNPAALRLLGSMPLGSSVNAVAVEAGFAVAIAGDVVIAIGVSAPSSPVELSRVTVLGARQVTLKGAFAVLAAQSSGYPVVDFFTDDYTADSIQMQSATFVAPFTLTTLGDDLRRDPALRANAPERVRVEADATQGAAPVCSALGVAPGKLNCAQRVS